MTSGLVVYLIVTKIQASQLADVSINFETRSSFLLVVVLVLMPVNWLLEAARWQLVLKKEGLTIKESLNAVLCGLSFNWLVPFTVGDAAGRLMNIRNKVSGVIGLMKNRILITIPTTALGGISVMYYLEWVPLMVIEAFILTFLCLGFGEIIWQLLSNKKLTLLGLTFLRYLVFGFQFYLLFTMFIPDLSGNTIIAGIGWIYLFRTFIPSLFGNFGVREASALVFFDFLPEPSLVLWPSMSIWVINTVLPSIFGALILFNLKFKIAE